MTLYQRIIILLCVIALAACQGKKKNESLDDSVEYWKIESRPPLRKASIVPTQKTQQNKKLTLQIVEKKSNTRLLVQGDFAATWEYMPSQLISGGISIFSKNKKGKEYEIGCDGIDNSEVKKAKRNWFSSRRKQAYYCFLKFRKTGKGVTISVHKRNGKEINAQAAKNFLSRIPSTQ